MRPVIRVLMFAVFATTTGCDRPTAPPPEPPAPSDLSVLDDQFVEVLQQALQYVRDAPHEAVRWARLGMLYESNNQPHLSMPCYRHAAKLDADEPKWWYRIAMMEHYDGNTDAAMQALRKTIDLKADFAPAWWRLGLWQIEIGKIDEALGSFKRAMAIDPTDRGAQLGLARVHLLRRDTEEAKAILEAYTRDHPSDAYAFHLLGTVYRQMGDLEHARVALGLGVGAEPHWRDPWYNEVFRYRVGFTAAMEAAQHRFASGDVEGMIALLEPWLDKRPDDVALLNNLGVAYIEARRIDDAFRVLQLAVEKFPDNYAGFLNLATAYQRKGRLNEALSSVDRSIALNPMLGKAYETKGLLLWQSGRPVEALGAFQESIKRDARHPIVQVWAGLVQCELDRWEEALATFEAVLRTDPAIAKAHSGRAFALIGLGRWEEAEEAIAKSEALQPNDAQLQEARRRLATAKAGAESTRAEETNEE